MDSQFSHKDREAQGRRLREYLSAEAPLRSEEGPLAKDFSWAHLEGEALTGKDLSGVRLQYVNFSKVDLSGSSFKNADIVGASFIDCDLNGAYMVGADLTGVTLSRVDLSGADLTGAVLHQAYLKKVNLLSVDLAQADLTAADLREVHLPYLRSLPAVVRDCKLDAATYQSGLALSTLLRWHQMGAVITDIEAFPAEAQRALRSVGKGLTLYFGSRMSNVDRFLVDGVIASFTETVPTSDCRLVEYLEMGETTRVRLDASDAEHLCTIAEALHQRIWEHSGPSEASPASPVLLQRALLPRLSWLVARGERFELWTEGDSGLEKQREWLIENSPESLLVELLGMLFSPDELRTFLRDAQGERFLWRLPPLRPYETFLHAAVDALKRQGGLDEPLFLRLYRARPARREDISHVAHRWGLSLPPNVLIEA